MAPNHTNQNLLDNINNCNILDISIEDTLYDISVSSTNNTLAEWWNNDIILKYPSLNNTQVTSVQVNTDFYRIQPNQPFTYYLGQTWRPVFVYPNTKEQKFSTNGIYNKNTLGTNEFISFDPVFKHSLEMQGNAKAVIPWKLNKSEFPYECTFGLLFWAMLENDTDIANKEAYPNKVYWKNIPPYMPFYYENTGPYIKISEDRILKPAPIDQLISSTLDIHKDYVTDDPKNIFPAYNTLLFSFDEKYTINKNRIKMWIPDGDVFSYKENIVKAENENKTYISAPLYQYYTAIYHALTINRKRSFNRDISQSRRYKSLAKYLAGSPFITIFCISDLIM